MHNSQQPNAIQLLEQVAAQDSKLAEFHDRIMTAYKAHADGQISYGELNNQMYDVAQLASVELKHLDQFRLVVRVTKEVVMKFTQPLDYQDAREFPSHHRQLPDPNVAPGRAPSSPGSYTVGSPSVPGTPITDSPVIKPARPRWR